ncbi:MAG TPA: NDP-sugar synthase [Candidatus Polarisedimenticolia bacterium]|nr:NDP-sugar synthase [Candidatus Polarisedimenticolia bacterium]
MKAMVLAAGMGERMRPLTGGRAKPSLPLLNRPMIVHTLDYLRRHQVREVVINLHHQADSIRGVVGDGSRLGLRVHYSEEPTLLGTAGGLKKAEPLLRNDDGGTFILINSDFACDCDLLAAVKKHRETGAMATLVLTPPRPGTDYGLVELGDRERILRLAGNPPGEPDPHAGRYVFTGIHVLEPGLFEQIPPNQKVEINRTVYPAMIAAGLSIRGFVHSGLWRELGTPRLYLEGTLAVLQDGRDPYLSSLRIGEGVFADRAEVPPGVSVEPPVLLGRGALLGERTSLQGVVIGRQARVGRGCSLRTTIVWDGARIGDGAKLSDCIVTSGVYVPPSVSLAGKIILRVEGYQGTKQRLERLGGCFMTDL